VRDDEDEIDGRAPPPSDAGDATTSHPGELPTLPSYPSHGISPRIGDYRIVRQLGEGGMGVVYEAEQRHPRRAVALKVIRGGAFVDESRVKMFQREAETLARLKHPGIAAIYESGRTEDGQHFFAMELVRGETLRDYLRASAPEGRLTPARIRERLRVFLRICDAVGYAHQRGVIHRDLKPSNILVLRPTTSIPTDPAPPTIKILDFGLARITGADVEMSTLVTELGKIRGTLPYMSPEQVRGNPDEIDLRTDVYSLGVILYQMLTGHLPHDVRTTAFHEGARRICEQPPRPLSMTWSATRRPDRDAETIVLKTLEKDPARRYQSVAALAEDVERYLGNQPILARPPSTLYQLRKMVARHKVGFGFAVTVSLLVVGFGVAMALQARRVAAERDRANAQAEAAEQISSFLVDVFRVPDPSESRGDTVTAREVLDRGAERIRAELVDQPEARASLMATIAEVYANLGLYDRAAKLAADAYAIEQALHPLADPGTARVLVLQANIAELRGDYKESERLARESLAIERRLAHPEDDRIAQIQQSLAVALKLQGRLDEAEEHYREALDLRRRLPEDNEAEVSSTLASLAELLRAKGHLDQAETLAREALDISRAAHGEVHPQVVSSLNNLALVLQDRGAPKEAEPLLRKAIELDKKLYGEDDPHVATAMNNLAALIRDNAPDEAEALHRRALAIRRAAFGENHPDVAASLNNLAVLLQRKGELDEAERLMREALKIVRTLLGNDHPHVGVSLYNLGRLLYRKGDWAGARDCLREALPIVERTSPPGHWRVGNVRSMLGGCLVRMGKLRDAEPLVLQGYETIRAARGPADHYTVSALERVVDLYRRWDKPAETSRYEALLPSPPESR
jgi:serine/threonine protein kinase/Tfp pilus assembly protein PilF